MADGVGRGCGAEVSAARRGKGAVGWWGKGERGNGGGRADLFRFCVWLVIIRSPPRALHLVFCHGQCHGDKPGLQKLI